MEPVQRLSHVGLTVRDLETSLAFWRDHVRLRELGRGLVEWEHLDRIIGLDGTQIEWAELELPGGTILELFAYRRPHAAPLPPGGMNRPGMAHICLEVDHIEQVVERLTAAGYQARSRELVTIPLGEYKDFKCIYFLDPDGVTLELSERPAGQPPAGQRPARRRRARSLIAHRTSHSDQEAGHHG
jgi:catechol 2,3-dioxygenase-like lactoylglutathione lyase family enzyme